MEHPLTFSKDERLCSRTIIDRLFVEKRSLFAFPFKVVFLPESPSDSVCQVIFTVPKRAFKRAVQRNVLRRRMREAYRLNHSQLVAFLEEAHIHLAVMFIYVDKEQLDYKKIEKGMKQAFSKIQKTLMADQ